MTSSPAKIALLLLAGLGFSVCDNGARNGQSLCDINCKAIVP